MPKKNKLSGTWHPRDQAPLNMNWGDVQSTCFTGSCRQNPEFGRLAREKGDRVLAVRCNAYHGAFADLRSRRPIQTSEENKVVKGRVASHFAKDNGFSVGRQGAIRAPTQGRNVALESACRRGYHLRAADAVV